MKTIKTYSTRIDAEVARIALDAAGVRSVVVGIGVGMEGGTAGVKLLVEDDRVDAALKVGVMSDSSAIDALERLRFRWRGDVLELKTLR